MGGRSLRLGERPARGSLKAACQKPGQINYASSGLGSINQIAAVLIAISAGIKPRHISYKGATQ